MKRRSRNNLHTQEMLYRPALEFRSALILILFSAYVLIDSWTSKYGISEIPFYCSGVNSDGRMEGMARGTGLHSSLAIISSHDGFLSLEDFRMINNAHFLLMTVNIRNWSVCRSLVEHHRRKVFTSSFVRKKRL